MDKLDILNRDKFVNQLVRLVENISDNKTSTCFAINGAWGSGKSFVLDMFVKRIERECSEETNSEKYFVIRYNSWKYDYYEEPLIAIVSATISDIEEKTKLFPDGEEKQKILGILKSAGMTLFSLINSEVKLRTGVDMESAIETVAKGEKEGTQRYEKDHAYDTYLELNKVIDKLSTTLQEIAETYTVIIIVDELDRCLPEYAIKVLERLHHLTEEKKNIITIVAVDKSRLANSVKHAFGFDDPEKYLEKFISFQIELDNGEVSDKIFTKYSDYVDLFDKDAIAFIEPVDECVQEIFKGIEVRTQEHIVKKTMLVHKLLFSDKKDYSFMCMELLIIVMLYVYKYDGLSKATINLKSYDRIFCPFANSHQPVFAKYFEEMLNISNIKADMDWPDGSYTRYSLPATPNLYATILYLWNGIHENKSSKRAFNDPIGDAYAPIEHSIDDLKKFIETLQIIK